MANATGPFFPVDSLAPFPAGIERPVRVRGPWTTGLVVLAWVSAVGTALGAVAGLSLGLVLFTPAVVVMGVTLGATAGLTLGIVVGSIAAVVAMLLRSEHSGNQVE